MKFNNKSYTLALLMLISLASSSSSLCIEPKAELHGIVNRIEHFISLATQRISDFFSKNNTETYRTHTNRIEQDITKLDELIDEIDSTHTELESSGMTQEAIVFKQVKEVILTLRHVLKDLSQTLSSVAPDRNALLIQKPLIAKEIATELGKFQIRFKKILTNLNQSEGKLEKAEESIREISPDAAENVRNIRRKIDTLMTSESAAFSTWMKILHRIKC